MVEPSWHLAAQRCRVPLGIGPSGLSRGLGLALALTLSGCSFVPKSRLDDCHRLSQTLQAENNRLKDTAISLRSQNQDLNQRAVDDARRLRVQEEEIQRLVQSVSAYQEDREQMAAAFERLKGQIRTSVNPVSSGLLERVQDLARSHPGWEFDPERGVLTIPAAQLFEAGSDRLRSEAEVWLRETAALWSMPEARDVDILVIGRNEASAVRRAALAPQDTQAPGAGSGQGENPAQGRPLGLARATRIRAGLVSAAALDARRIEVAGFEVPQSGADGDSASQARQRRIEIHFRHRAGAAAAATPAAADPKAPVPAGALGDRTHP